MGVFLPIWPALRRGGATNLGAFDLCHFALISPYSNGAVPIRVGLELAEKFQASHPFFFKIRALRGVGRSLIPPIFFKIRALRGVGRSLIPLT